MTTRGREYRIAFSVGATQALLCMLASFAVASLWGSAKFRFALTLGFSSSSFPENENFWKEHWMSYPFLVHGILKEIDCDVNS